MEVNKYNDVFGVVTTQDIPEGRLVVLTPHSEKYNFGNRDDLPGVKLPATADEAAKAKYVLGFAVDNRPTPLVESYPAQEFALRQGFGSAPNVPFTAKIYTTHPSNMAGTMTVVSGSLALAFDGGVFTVYSGSFIPSSNLVKGAYLTAADATSDSAADAGKLKYTSSGGLAVVEEYDSSNQTLRFRML